MNRSPSCFPSLPNSRRERLAGTFPSLLPLTMAGLGLASFFMLPGCGWWLRITEVSGTVTVDGKPAGAVQLVFDPLDKSRPRAMALTGPDGSFRLGRQGPGDKSGAAAGKYIVRVMSDNDGGEGFTIPARYNRQSALEFDVVPGQANVFEIDIDTKPDAE